MDTSVDLEGGRFSKVAVEAERVMIVSLEKLALVSRAWRIEVPIVPLACELVC